MRRLRRVARGIAVGVAAVTLVVGIGGTLAESDTLMGFGEGRPPMKPNTALGLLLASLALWLDLAAHPRPWQLHAKRIASGAVVAIGAATLVEHATEWDLHLDALFRAIGIGGSAHGRMSVGAAVSLVLIGLGLGLPDSRIRTMPIGSVLTRIPALVGYFSVLGYAYGVEALYAPPHLHATSLPVGLALLGLGVALASTRQDAVSRMFIVDGAGGVLARRLLPAALLVPPTLGWLRLLGERAGYYGLEVGLTIFATSNVVTFTILVLVTSRALERTHREVAEREENLAITLNSIGDGVIATDTEGRVVRMNPVAEELTGWPLEQARGRRLREVFRIVHEDSGEPVDSPVDRVLREGTVVGLANHTALIARDGGSRPIADSGAPIKDRDGAIRGVVLVFRDQSQERHAEEAQARFARLAESGLFGVAVARRDGAIEEANDEFLRLIGRTRDDLTRGGCRWRDLVPPDLASRSIETIRLLETRGVTDVEETEYLRPDGSRIPVLRGAAALTGDRSIAFALDLSTLRAEARARREAEDKLADRDAQLWQSRKMEAIGQLAGGVAHDFNNLLSVILSYTSLLEEELGPDHPAAADVGEIQKAGARATELTRQLLAFGRRQMLEPRPVDLREVLDGMSTMLRRVIGEDVELSVDTSPGRRRVLVDPGPFEQVLLNLVVNARDAMPTGGTLTITTADVELTDTPPHPEMSPGPYVVISVADSGTGIPPEVLPRIFEPFFTTKAVGKGTGLGLATSFGVVKQSGGHITVESEVGRGTTFRIFLPCASPDAAPSVPPPAEVAPTTGTETILLVEDHDQVRRVSRRVLEGAGYRVLEAESGPQALEVAEAHSGPIDLLLTDIIMPKMSGRELAEKLLLVRPELPVLYMSGYTDDRIVQHGVETASVELLQKPASPAALLAKVRAVLGR